MAFVLVSAVALGVVGFISAASTRAEFGALLGAQAREDLGTQVRTYLAARGTLEDFRPAGPPAPPPPRPPRGGSPPPPEGPGPFVSRGAWIVLDPDRRAVFSTPDVARGTRVTGRPETPVTAGGRVVAYLVPSGLRAQPDPRSQEFLARTVRALAWAMLGAGVLAVLMGLLVARTLLRPLRELLAGIRALGRGEAPALPGRARADEFGEVLSAFGEMHRAVERNQQARRQLTADIAHDLNTPLTVIAGTLEAMLDGTFEPTAQRLRRLHLETRHVARLVNDLRFLALADAGELHVNRQPAEVALLVADAVAGFRAVAEGQGVAVETRLEDVTVSLDRVRITQVLQNLLANALAHTPGGGRVDVRARLEGGRLHVGVADTGSGIAPEHLPHVFDRLYRADGARSAGGSGLGLSICRSIVEAHGGEIRLTSRPGAGTSVTFTLPLETPRGT
nr:ATP-binding protein [Deinococcus aestuarii]